MADTTLGLDVDGMHVTVVECVGDVAVSVRSVKLDELKDTVDLVLAGYKQHRNDPPFRVALSCDQIVTRAIDVTPAMKNRQTFEDTVYTALPLDRNATMTAGLFFDPGALSAPSNTLSAGVAAVAPRIAISNTYRAFGTRRVEVVPPSFALVGMDGLWLGLRYGVSDLTLVVNGRPVQYRQLRAGGLDSVAGLLGEDETGVERLEAALHRSGPSDPVAEAEIDRWLRIIAMETRQTIDFWSRGGDVIPESLIPYGAASVAVGVEGALASANLVAAFPDDLNRAMSFIPPADRPAAVLAFAAARTVGVGAPQSVFVNPVASELISENRRRNRQLIRIGAAAAAATALFATTIVPITTAYIDRQSAAADLSVAQGNFLPVADAYEKLARSYLREDAIIAVSIDDQQWSDVVRIALDLAPQVNITQFSSSRARNDQGVTVVLVTINAEKIRGNYNDLTIWLDDLRRTNGITKAWSSSYTNRNEKASYQLSFEIDPTTLGIPRDNASIIPSNKTTDETSSSETEIPVIGITEGENQ